MTTIPTFCNSCDNVIADTRKQPPYRWLCSRHKRLEGVGFVDPDYWAKHEPYLRCVDVNSGACPLWAPLKNGADK